MSENFRIEQLRRRLHEDPASIAFAQLGEELRRAGRHQEAVDVCRTGLASYPAYLSARVTLGRALIDLNQLDEAQTELEKFLKIHRAASRRLEHSKSSSSVEILRGRPLLWRHDVAGHSTTGSTSEPGERLSPSSPGCLLSMSHAPAVALRRRHEVVRHVCAAQSLDALCSTSLPNVVYLTIFTGSAGIVVLTADRLHFITDVRYVSAVEATRDQPHGCPGLELVPVDASYDATLVSLLQTMPSARGGFGGGH